MPFGLSKATVLGAAGAAGGGGAIQWIAGMNGDGSSDSLLFDNIPQTYKHLRIVMSNMHQTATNSYTYFKVNDSVNHVYKSADYWTDSSTVYNFWRTQSQTNKWPDHYTPGGTATTVGSHIIDWMGYTSSGGDGDSTYSGFPQSFMLASYGHTEDAIDLHTGGICAQSTTGSAIAITSIEITTYHSSDHWRTETRADMYGIGTAAS